MKNLEKFIDSHRDELDKMEPPVGHFIRFRDKLNQTNWISLKWIIRIAAVLLIASFLSVNLFLFHTVSNKNLSSDMKETAYFYNSRSEKILFEIQNNKRMNSSEKQLIMKDVQDFEKEYSTILDDLKKFPGDERLVNAFIEYHRSKAEFLEDILNQINASNLITI
jgi:uncharacterized membrane protein YvbJ